MTLKLITAPSLEPVTLAEAKLHLRVDTADEDALISALITAARQRAEHHLQRSLVTQTWERVLDAFPEAEIELGVPPVQGITSIVYADAQGVTQTISAAAYVLDAVRDPGWVLPASGYAWPATASTVNAVRVRFTSGYGAPSAVPESIKAWIKLHIGALYENREAVVSGNSAASTELAGRFTDGLLDPYRIWSA